VIRTTPNIGTLRVRALPPAVVLYLLPSVARAFYPPAVLLVGLTGGIGSGKTTVADLLAAKGAAIVDADQVARAVVEPGTSALAQLVERFGAEILDADGRLDRPRLGRLAFVDEQSRKDLEAITHPAIGAEFIRRVSEAPADAVVVHDVPLLVEANRAGDYAGVVVVDAPLEVRLARLVARGVAREDAERRIAMQASDEERRKVATWRVDNAGDFDDLEKQIDAIWTDLQDRLGSNRA
jgi:dephospho-CoA kinase